MSKTGLIFTAIIGLGVGFGLGYVIGKKVSDKKAIQTINESIEEFQTAFSKRTSNHESSTEEQEDEFGEEYSEPKTDISTANTPIPEYMAKIVNYAEAVEEDRDDMTTIISSDEHYSISGYRVIYLTLYINDELVTDQFDNIVENPDDILGSEYLYYAGKQGVDDFYVRNDRTRTDYHITVDYRAYESETDE